MCSIQKPNRKTPGADAFHVLVMDIYIAQTIVRLCCLTLAVKLTLSFRNFICVYTKTKL